MNLRREKISQNGEFYRCFSLNGVSPIEQKRKACGALLLDLV